MSYSYERVERRSRTSGGGRGGPTLGHSGRRSTLGYWVPLFMTVTVATVGFAAWVWSERRDDEEESSGDEHRPVRPGPGPGPGGQAGYASMSGGVAPGSGPTGYQGPGPHPASGPAPEPPSAAEYYADTSRSTAINVQGGTNEDGTLVGRMSGALKRTPSPQQGYDWASKTVAAGVAAAGAMVGGALKSITEGSQEGYEDHERWSEEAESREVAARSKGKGKLERRGTADEYFNTPVQEPVGVAVKSRNRKTVVVVVSAVDGGSSGGEVDHHASLLAHLPEYIDPLTTRVVVLIYAPELTSHPLGVSSSLKGGSSITHESRTSSFSNISHGDARTPGEFPGNSDGSLAHLDPNPMDNTSPLFKTLYNQAMTIVEKDSMILPFTTPTGHLHILRSLAPRTVYIQQSLCGEDGEVASSLSGWVKQIVVVIGDEGGHGGLVDTDDEGGVGKERSQEWWQREDRTGLGRGIAVVESLKIGDDWRRRIGGHD